MGRGWGANSYLHTTGLLSLCRKRNKQRGFCQAPLSHKDFRSKSADWLAVKQGDSVDCGGLSPLELWLSVTWSDSKALSCGVEVGVCVLSWVGVFYFYRSVCEFCFFLSLCPCVAAEVPPPPPKEVVLLISLQSTEALSFVP